MKLRFLMTGIIVVALVAIGSLRLFQITGSATSAEGNQEVGVVIDDGLSVSEYNVTLNPKETAFDALKHTATSQKAVESKYVSGYASITGINGVKQDRNHTWICLINDKIPDVECDQYYPTAGDVIKFRYADVG